VRAFISNKLSRPLAFGLSLLALSGFWQAAAMHLNSPLILPLPSEVFRQLLLGLGSPVFLRHFGISCLRSLLAIGLTLAAGSVSGLGAGLSAAFRAFAAVPLAIIRAVPVAAIILLAVFWLGSDALPVFVALLMGLPVMTDAVAAGITKIPARLVDAAKVYRFSRRKLLFHVYIPAALPNFLSGLRSVFGLSWKVVVAGEVLVLPRYGAGSLLYTAKVHLETAQVFAIVILMVIICLALETLFFLLPRCFRKQRNNLAAVPADSAGIANSKPPIAPSSVRVENLGVTRGSQELFRGFSTEFQQGKLTAVIAASGRGKTTLLDCIAGILSPGKGRVVLRNPGQPDRTGFPVSYLFQEPQLLPWRSILRNAALPLEGAIPRQNARVAAGRLLAKTGLGLRLGAYPDQLSGGEQRRAALARAFAFPAPALLMDEAFQSQDLPLKLSLMTLTKTLLREDPRTVILVTHDVREALCIADRILALTGRPLGIARDIAVPAVSEEDTKAAITERYIHLPPDLAVIEEDIFSALSKDTV
jgi:ABC-type nitrate/sulfonate/bicarbonate transport system ATPase subunit/ABC-type nitrate/sulfonate/bicarbonate transport system permease component